MPDTTATLTLDATTMAQLRDPIQELMKVLDPIERWGVLGRSDHRVTKVPEAAFDIHQHLALLPEIMPGKATLKADSPRYGAFSVERNGRAPWVLWVRAHDDSGDSWTFGLQGFALQIGYQPEDTYVSKHVDAALAVMKKVLMDPDVQLRGGVFPEETSH